VRWLPEGAAAFRLGCFVTQVRVAVTEVVEGKAISVVKRVEPFVDVKTLAVKRMKHS
jgi:hypothetical protein